MVPGIAENNLFITMQQVVELRDVGDLRGGADYRMNQAARTVDTDMGLHAEVPLVALSGLAHLGIALAFLVLRGARRVNDRGINQRALPQQQTPVCQVLIDGLK